MFGDAGRMLLFVGTLMLLAGGLLLLGERVFSGHFAWRLPGDIVIRRERFVLWFPLGTCLLLSLLLTLAFWVMNLFRR